MKHLLAILLILHSPFFILHLEATTARLGSIKATEYVVTEESDATAMAYATAVSNKLESGKQATLVSGTNIKTVNNLSLLGSGNISIEGGGSLPANYLEPATNYTDAATNAAIASANAYTDAAVTAATNGISAARITDGTNTLTAAREWTHPVMGEWSGEAIETYKAQGTVTMESREDSSTCWRIYIYVDGVSMGAVNKNSVYDGWQSKLEMDNATSGYCIGNYGGGWIYRSLVPVATLLATTNDLAAIGAKRDLTNNVCAADSFTAWDFGGAGLTNATLELSQNDDDSWTYYLEAEIISGGSIADYVTESGTKEEMANICSVSVTEGAPAVLYTITREKVTYSNELFVTYSFVTNAAGKGGASISTNAVDALIASYDATNLTARINAKAGRITDAVYDFNYGTNFTRRLYETLTNLIDRFGGTVTNAPTFN